MILGIVYNTEESIYIGPTIHNISDSVSMAQIYLREIPRYVKEIAIAIFPICAFFSIYQILILKLKKNDVIKILVGFIYTYIGLVLFLTGVHIGFLPAGHYLGQIIVSYNMPWLIIPIAMIIGYFVVRAEPAIYVLNKQVEEITDGNISAKTMGFALSIGVAISLGLAMLRVLTGISIMWFLLPGYFIAIIISFFVPKLYTAIAFDSGGVASGPMTATFLLPLAQGVCVAIGGDIIKDAFGVVAMVAMTPLITIQVLGFLSQIRTRSKQTEILPVWEQFDDSTIIEL